VKITINSPKYGLHEILIDDEDYEKIKDYKWCVHYQHNVNNFYVVRMKKDEFGIYRTIFLHRLITNCHKALVVDHINHNTLDNRKENLRICTRSQNGRNRKISKNKSSKYKGVNFHKGNMKWQAMIRFNDQHKYLGIFENEEDAAKAYNEAAVKYHGEFALLNILKS